LKLITKRSARKLDQLFKQNNIDFVNGMKKLLYSFSQPDNLVYNSPIFEVIPYHLKRGVPDGLGLDQR
jgi:hypothetical protein